MQIQFFQDMVYEQFQYFQPMVLEMLLTEICDFQSLASCQPLKYIQPIGIYKLDIEWDRIWGMYGWMYGWSLDTDTDTEIFGVDFIGFNQEWACNYGIHIINGNFSW